MKTMKPASKLSILAILLNAPDILTHLPSVFSLGNNVVTSAFTILKASSILQMPKVNHSVGSFILVTCFAWWDIISHLSTDHYYQVRKDCRLLKSNTMMIDCFANKGIHSRITRTLIVWFLYHNHYSCIFFYFQSIFSSFAPVVKGECVDGPRVRTRISVCTISTTIYVCIINTSKYIKNQRSPDLSQSI